MFEKNMVAFNPGWNQNAEPTDSFEDVRDIRKKLIEKGIAIDSEIESESGPASFTVIDPDGNPVLIDQHR